MKQLKKIILSSLAITGALSACIPSVAPLSIQLATEPERVAALSTSDLCRTIRISEGNPEWGEQDRKAAYATLRKRGFTKRDAELISKKGQFWGTGMTFAGLRCSSGSITKINKSFHQYSGHHWQVVMGDHSEFVYLQGDGTETGMKVTGWN